MDDMEGEGGSPVAKVLLALGVLAAVGAALYAYGISPGDLWILAVFAYFLISALAFRRRDGSKAPPRRETDDDWGFDLADDPKGKKKDDDWGFDFGDDEKEEEKYLSAKKVIPSEGDDDDIAALYRDR